MLTLTDLFCGAGGSSTGAVMVPGVQVRVASNHWQLAVDTHETNHPDTGHVCADLSQIDPRFYPSTDILWASPECTNHSRAKGGKKKEITLFDQIPDEAAERSRATMWDVPRFTEAHRYQAIIVENVVEVANWAPYVAWLQAMDSLGYHHEVVYMNSMHTWALGNPAPQSRDRFYAIFWRKGNRRPDLNAIQRPPAYCVDHGRVEAIKAYKNSRRWGRYKSQYVFRCPHTSCRGREVLPAWLPAASIIDWSNLGTRIGDRERPLAVKTMRRIQAGIARYWSGAEVDPLIVNHVSGSDGSRSSSVHEVAPTMVAGGLHASLLVPVEGREGKEARSTAEALRTQTTRNETGLLVPAGGTWNEEARPLSDPARTRTTRETEGVVFPPFIAELRGGGSDARSTTDPLSTVTASGNHHGLVMRNNTGGAEMSTPTDEPVRTITTHGHQSLITGGVPNIEDCSFRMLTPHEIARAMAFPADYQMLGTKRDQVKLAGNAVTPPAARDLVAACAESLGVAA
ncbi:DNA cytosine methyltransferase [Brevibacterium casei]|uniref:DNA cytosine methyltransferase n=1 Tax=Brevibacterium casei TaxID=33889 RepID=UPI0021AE4BD2|nr:DNA cytosine methyltransferase [Brevibacterium casei]MCT2357048.1 DNA cytosine methyltransferase [Brevibacterium casei]